MIFWDQLLNIFIIFIACEVATSVAVTERLKIMRAILNLDEFYLKVREQNEKIHEQESETTVDSQTKSRLCESILTGVIPGLKPAKLGTWFSYSLRDMRICGLKCLRDMEDEQRTILRTPFKYPSIKRLIHLKRSGQFVTDDAFMCIGIYFDEYVRFYVSKEYNVNPEPGLYVPGRFLFRGHPSLNVFYLAFLATEPANVLEESRHEVEQLYLANRLLEIPATKRPEDDPLCNLSEIHRIRICSSVLNSAYFDRRIYYRISFTSTRCVKNDVSFRSAADIRFGEWMIKCVPVARIRTGSALRGRLQTLYVSKGVNSKNFFVYYRDLGRDRCHLLNLSSNEVRYFMNV